MGINTMGIKSLMAAALVSLGLAGCGELSGPGVEARRLVLETITDASAKQGGTFSAELPGGGFAVLASGSYHGLESPLLSAYYVAENQVYAVNGFAMKASPGIKKSPAGVNYSTIHQAVVDNY